MAVDDPGVTFKFVGGRLCLDFINTASGRGPRAGVTGRDYEDGIENERLGTFADLTRWGRDAGVLSAAELAAQDRAARARPAQAHRVVVRARALRHALYRLFKAAVERWSPEEADLAVVNRELRHARAHEQLTPGSRRLTWMWRADAAALDRVLWNAVRSAADLLTSEDLLRVNQCGGEDCRWLFIDTSRSRRRRWCDMADCGNRAKARRFRRHHRSTRHIA